VESRNRKQTDREDDRLGQEGLGAEITTVDVTRQTSVYNGSPSVAKDA
jgi:hypothetical protein